MIEIKMPSFDVVITKQKVLGNPGTAMSEFYGFTEYKKIPRGVPGIYLFFNEDNELLYCGQTNSLRSRIREHFYSESSAIKEHRQEVHKIAVSFVKDPYEREIFETFIIHELKSKYNIGKVFFR